MPLVVEVCQEISAADGRAVSMIRDSQIYYEDGLKYVRSAQDK